MSVWVQQLRDTATNLASSVLKLGMIAYDTTNNMLRIFDGSTSGGRLVPTVSAVPAANAIAFGSSAGQLTQDATNLIFNDSTYTLSTINVSAQSLVLSQSTTYSATQFYIKNTGTTGSSSSALQFSNAYSGGYTGSIVLTGGAYLAAAAQQIVVQGGGTGGVLLQSTVSTAPIDFAAGGSSSVQARLDASGHFMVGYTSSQGSYNLQINGNGLFNGTVNSTGNTTSNTASDFYAQRTGATETASIQQGANITLINTTNTTAVCIQQYSGNMQFFTYSGAWSERMRVTAAGQLLVGYTSSNGSYALQANGQIFATSATIATSDARLKTDIADFGPGAGDLVDRLRVRLFSFAPHEVHHFPPGRQLGLIAQEVRDALKGQDWAQSLVAEGEDGLLGLAYDRLAVLAIKALQEERAARHALQARLERLESYLAFRDR